MLLVHDLDFLSCLSDEFDFVVTPSPDCGGIIRGGRPSGGVAIFWRKTFSSLIIPISLTNRFLGVRIQDGRNQLLLVNAYLPCDYGGAQSLCEFRSSLASLSEILMTEHCSNFILGGDLNADPSGGRFWREVQEFLNSNSMICADLVLPIDTFTFLSAANNSTRWLDHILVPKNYAVRNIHVVLDLSYCDHFPIGFDLEINGHLNVHSELSSKVRKELFVKWQNFDSELISVYEQDVRSRLDDFMCDAFVCSDYNCSEKSHRLQLDEAFKFLKDSLLLCTSQHTFERMKRGKIVPGWNDLYVKTCTTKPISPFINGGMQEKLAMETFMII